MAVPHASAAKALCDSRVWGVSGSFSFAAFRFRQPQHTVTCTISSGEELCDFFWEFWGGRLVMTSYVLISALPKTLCYPQIEPIWASLE